MTNAEAIEILKEIIQPFLCVSEGKCWEAIDMAIAALEKQAQKKPLTNADSIRDSIRQMTDEELSNLLSTVQSSIALNVVNALQPFFDKACYDNAIKQVRDRSTQNQREWLDWLKQEVKE